jgi:hypothetical protein
LSRILFSTRYQHCLIKSRERSKEIAKNNKDKHAFSGSYRVDSCAATSSHRATPPPPRSPWWPAPPSSYPYTPQPSASPTPNPRVLERPPSPSPNRPVYRPMDPSYHDASPRGCHGLPCVVYGWGPCPNPVTLMIRSLSRGREGEEEEGEGEEEPRWISVVPSLLQRSLTRQTTRKTVGS